MLFYNLPFHKLPNRIKYISVTLFSKDCRVPSCEQTTLNLGILLFLIFRVIQYFTIILKAVMNFPINNLHTYTWLAYKNKFLKILLLKQSEGIFSHLLFHITRLLSTHLYSTLFFQQQDLGIYLSLQFSQHPLLSFLQKCQFLNRKQYPILISYLFE